MRIKFTITLIILNITLLGAIWMLNNQASRNLGPTANKLITFQTPEIKRFEIEGKNASFKRTLELKEDGWHITSPIDWPANVYAIQRILTHIEFLEESTSFSVTELEKQGLSLADYGLDDPSIVLTVEAEEGQSIRLAMGLVSPIEKRVYALHPDGQSVHLINNTLLESLLIDFEDIRSQEIFSIPQYEVKGLSVKVDPINLAIILNRENEEWHLKAPIQTKASSRQVSSVLNELGSIRVNRFLKPEEKDSTQLGLSVPAMRVTLSGNNRRQTLKLGTLLQGDSDNPEFIAQLEDSLSIFTVSAKPFLQLRESQDRFREKRFLAFEPDTLTSIEVARNEKTVFLQRLETGLWQVMGLSEQGHPQVQAADSNIILDLIQQLHDLQAIRFANDAPSEDDHERFGFAQPQRVVKLNNDPEHTLLVGDMNRDSGLFYVKLTNEPFVYEVSSRILTLLQANPLHYQSRLIDSVPHSAKILSLSLKDIEKQNTLFEEQLNEGQTWEERFTDYPQEKTNAAIQILALLKRFEVENYFLSNFNDTTFSLDKETQVPWRYRLEVDYLLPGSDSEMPKRKAFTFTERLGGNLQIGRLPDSPHAFRLKQDLIDALFNFTFEREADTSTDPINLNTPQEEDSPAWEVH